MVALNYKLFNLTREPLQSLHLQPSELIASESAALLHCMSVSAYHCPYERKDSKTNTNYLTAGDIFHEGRRKKHESVINMSKNEQTCSRLVAQSPAGIKS